MINKRVNHQIVWLILGVLANLVSFAASSCNSTIVIKKFYNGRIAIPKDSSSCEWRIIVPDDVSLKMYFSRFKLEECPGCKCESIEVWELDPETLHPKTIVEKLCGDLSHAMIFITEKYSILKYLSRSGIMDKQRYMYYKVYDIDDDDSHDEHGDHHRHHKKKRKHKHGGRPAGITTTAIGILLALAILIGALACGICLVHCAVKPKRRQRRRQRLAQELTTPTISGQTKLPHLPNYYDNEGAIPPPYLETIGNDGNPVSPPTYYENPPPYSILDTSNTLETTEDRRSNGRSIQT